MTVVARARRNFARLFPIAALCASALLPAPAAAQSAAAQSASALPGSERQVRFGHVGRAEGLMNQSVSSIVQDSRGFLWFGTKGGLARYDGNAFVVYRNEPFNARSLSHNLVQTLAMDLDDVLWVGTYRGLNRFDTRTRRFTRYAHDPADPTSISHDVVTAIRRDRKGRLWVGTLDGLNLMDEERGTFRRYRDEDPLSGAPENDTVRAILETRDGTVWVGTYGGIFRYDPEKDAFHPYVPAGGLPSNTIMVLAEDPSGAVWIACWDGGVVRIDPTGRTKTWVLPDNRLYTLVTDGADTVYAGTWGGGLYELNVADGTWRAYRAAPKEPFALTHDVIYSLFVDASGLLWIGTHGDGLNKLDRGLDGVALYRHGADPGSLTQGPVMAVLEDSRGRLWVGTFNGGLSRLDPGAAAFKQYRYDPRDAGSLSNDIVNAIMEDAAGTIWVATNEGLCRYEDRSDRFVPIHGGEGSGGPLADMTVYALAQDRQGRYWYGYYRKGVERYDPRTGERRRYARNAAYPMSLSDDLVYGILVDSQERVWIGTNSGLNRFVPAQDGFIQYKHRDDDPTSLPSDSVRSLLEDSAGRLWFGTASGGLSLLDPDTGRFANVLKEDGLSDDTILSIQEDKLGRLWLGTTDGLCIFDPETREIKHLDLADGLQGWEFTNASFKNAAGELFFGGTEGLNRITNPDLRRDRYAPPVRITSFKVFDREVDLGKDPADVRRIDLSPRENFVSIEFAALDYHDPKSNRYLYMLEGFDKAWIDPGTRRYANYTNLPGGNYQFRVKACNSQGVWNEAGAVLNLRVSPPFWVTPAAYVLYAVLALAAFGALTAWSGRGQRLRLSEAELAERRRIEADLQAAKNAAEAANLAKSEFLASLSHEIRTPMNAVLGYAGILAESMEGDPRKQLVETVERSGRNLLVLLNDALDLSRIEAGKTPTRRAPIAMVTVVAELVDMFRLRAEQKGLSLCATVDAAVPEYVLGDETKVRQILVNLVGNAVKFTERGQVSIRVDAVPAPASARSTDVEARTTLILRVEDTGPGLDEASRERIFEAFYQEPRTGALYGGSGLGLSIVKRLAEGLGGSVNVRSNAEGGSTFWVILPGMDATASAPAPADSGEQRRLDGVKVLIIEDDAENADIMERLLGGRGAAVRRGGSGNEGLRLLEFARPDVVLLDLSIPTMDCVAFLSIMRKRPAGASIPVIAVTADLRDETCTALVTQGVADVVPKPVSRGRLLDAVAKAAAAGAAAAPSGTGGVAAGADRLSFDALRAELGAERAERLAETIAARLLPIFKELSPGLVVDEWIALAEAAERLVAEVPSAVLGSWAGRVRAATAELDSDSLEALAAELNGFA